MCGIVYAFRTDNKPARKRIMKRYARQSHRGEDGFGYVALAEDGSVLEYHRSQEEHEVRAALAESKSRHVLFHHRFPTSTANVAEAAHPIYVKHEELKHSYYIVHNGVISNHAELYAKHKALGYVYTTEIQTQYRTASGIVYTGETKYNDSEALAIELARTIEGLQPRCEAKGTIAWMALQTGKLGKKASALYYGTNGGNPLTITEDEYGICIASENGMPLPANKTWRVDFKTGRRKLVQVPLIAYEYPKQTAYPYGHYSGHGFSYASQKGYTYTGKDDERDSYSPPDDEPEEDSITDEDVAGVWGYTLEELEEHAADIEADMEIALAAQEQDEFDALAIELDGVREQIEAEMERLMNGTETSTKRIGF